MMEEMFYFSGRDRRMAEIGRVAEASYYEGPPRDCPVCGAPPEAACDCEEVEG